MDAIVIISKNRGMLKNNKRLIFDQGIKDEILNISAFRKIIIDDFSKDLFNDLELKNKVKIEKNLLGKVSLFLNKNNVFLIENKSLKGLEDKVDNLYIFTFNKNLDADFFFDADLTKFDFIKEKKIFGYKYSTITLRKFSNAPKIKIKVA